MTTDIHPTALIDPSAQIGEGVRIGAFSIIGADVSLGEGTTIASHVVIKGPTHIGKHNHIFQHTSIGEDCQDKKYHGERTFLEIGDHNIIRENCTIHRGTAQDKGVTHIGSHNLFMVNVHVAHDCIIGDNCIFANNATLAGHVHIGDFVIFGGHAAIHQFGQVGSHAFIAGCAALNKDVPPYVIAAGHYAKPFGINSEGLRRRGFSDHAITGIKRGYRELFRAGLTLPEAVMRLQALVPEFPEVQAYLDFIAVNERGILRGD